MRESLQNSLDERLESSVEVVYRLVRLTGPSLDRFLDALKWDELEAHISAATESTQKLGRALKTGLERLQQERELILLEVEDRGARGLIGEEWGEGNFAALTRNNLDSLTEPVGR